MVGMRALRDIATSTVLKTFYVCESASRVYTLIDVHATSYHRCEFDSQCTTQTGVVNNIDRQLEFINI